MRRYSSSAGLVALSQALFAISAVGCGHAISIPDWRTAGGGAGSQGGAGVGAYTNTLIQEIPLGDNSTGGAAPTGTCPTQTMPSEPTLPGYTAKRDPEVDKLVGLMTNDDKFKQMYGVPDPSTRDGAAYGNIEQSLDVTDLPNGQLLRGLKYRDAGRGVNLDARQPNNRPYPNPEHGYSTAYPAAATRAASWDVDLEMQIGEAIGDETMASYNNHMLAPCMNILRHPYWGRSQETYGEDMHQTGRMASALTAGIQKHVIATAKHYAANNIENGRQRQNAEMDEQTLREVYVQHFAMVVQQGGVGSVMAAYNSVNGKKCTQNKHLLTDILKAPPEQNGLGFRGFLITDWWAMPGDDAHATDTSLAEQHAAEAVNAGLDLEVPWQLNFAQLGAALDQGDISIAQINESVARILEQKFRFGAAYASNASDPKSGPWGLGTPITKLDTGAMSDSLINNEKHLDLAEEAEVRSAVLLTNGTGGTPVLPIKGDGSIKSVAVVGLDLPITVSTATNLQPGGSSTQHFATDINTGDRGSSRVNSDPAKSIGPFDGIKAAASRHQITNVTSGNSAAAAQSADFVVLVVGLTAGDEGEEYSVKSLGDRTTLDLPSGQNDFINSVLDLQKPTVIIIESGSIVNVPWLSHSNKQQATVWAGYSGQQGGAAYGTLLFGDRNFGGKLAVSWPQESDMNTLLPFRDPNTQSVVMPYFHGYRLYDMHPEAKLVFPFGHGLSYTTFQYSNLQIPCVTAKKSDVVNVTADIENTGSVAGDETMMLFVAGPKPASAVSPYRPVKELKRFQRVNSIQPKGQVKSRFRVTFPIRIQDLQHWDGDANGHWVVDSGDYTIYVGSSAQTVPLQGKLTVQGD